jgi:hypothetical protein
MAEALESDKRVLQVVFSRQALAAGMTWQWIADQVGGMSAVAARRYYVRHEKSIGPAQLREVAERVKIPYPVLKG